MCIKTSVIKTQGWNNNFVLKNIVELSETCLIFWKMLKFLKNVEIEIF